MYELKFAPQTRKQIKLIRDAGLKKKIIQNPQNNPK